MGQLKYTQLPVFNQKIMRSYLEDRSRSKSVPGMAAGVRDSFTVNEGKRFTSI